MAFYDEFPYTNFQELNLDKIIHKIGDIDRAEEATAESAAAAKASEEAAAVSETNAAASASSASQSADASAASAQESAQYLEDIGTHTAGAVSDWLAEHVTTPTTPPVDTSLTIAGAAADAKATGDAVTEVNSHLESITGVEFLNLWQSGGYYESAEETDTIDINSYVESNNYVRMVVPCVAGDVFHVTSVGANHARNWVFLSSLSDENNIISRSEKNIYTLSDEYITAPAGAVYAVFNARAANDHSVSKGKYVPEILTILNTQSQIYKGTAKATDYENLISHITSLGTHYIRSASVDTYNDRPVNAPSNSAGILVVENYADTLVYQTYYGGKGHILRRLINTTTFNPYTTGIECDEHGWFVQTEITQANNRINRINAMHRWDQKTLVCFGDSRTWYDGKAYTSRTKPEWTGKTCAGYQKQINNLCGMQTINQGVSGETSVQICNRIREYDFSSCDAAFFEGGVNDFIKSSQVTIGELMPIGSQFDVTTAYGAWQSAIEYILTNYPQVKLYLDIPAIAWDDDVVFPYNMAKIKGDIAELYNIPCLDLYKNAGINTVNRNYWYADDSELTGWHLHFNDYGNALVGAIIAEFINTH